MTGLRGGYFMSFISILLLYNSETSLCSPKFEQTFSTTTTTVTIATTTSTSTTTTADLT